MNDINLGLGDQGDPPTLEQRLQMCASIQAPYSSDISVITRLSQAEYDAIIAPNPATLYLIDGNTVSGGGGGSNVVTVFGRAGNVTAVGGDYTAAEITETATRLFLSDTDKSKLDAISGTNTGDQTSIVGITGTKAEFDTAVTDGNIQYVGDAPTSHTHTASEVTNFDTEVGNQTDVAANTAARHAAVTVADTAEIDLTLTGQQISAAIVASSIDEAKLDASVNASLDLADSASQPGHTHTTSSLTNDAGFSDDQTGAEIKSAYEGEANTNAFTDAEQTKLSGVETGADVTDATNVTAAGALMDSECVNLAAVKAFTGEAAATADQTAAEILAALITVDGTASGLDADLLDGNEAAAFALTGQKLDDFGATDDNTDLDATVSAHGLLPKLGGGTTDFLRADGTWSAPPDPGGGKRALGWDIVGTPTPGSKVALHVPYNCTINEGRVLTGDPGGSISADVWKDSYANFPPVVGDKISAAAPLTVSGSDKSTDVTLTGWTKTLLVGDVLILDVLSVSGITSWAKFILMVDLD